MTRLLRAGRLLLCRQLRKLNRRPQRRYSYAQPNRHGHTATIADSNAHTTAYSYSNIYPNQRSNTLTVAYSNSHPNSVCYANDCAIY